MHDALSLFIPLSWHGKAEIRAMRGHFALLDVVAIITQAYGASAVPESFEIEPVWATWHLPPNDNEDSFESAGPQLEWQDSAPDIEHSEGWFPITLIRSEV